MRTLFKNCVIIATDSEGHLNPIKGSCLIVNNELIEYIGKIPTDIDDCIIKDMHGAILMPGLVNAHCHSPMTLLRGVGSGLPLEDWLNNAIFPLEAKMTRDDIYFGQMWAAIEYLKSGTTLIADMYDFPDAAWEAMKNVGMKANISRVGLSFSETQEMPPNRLFECIQFIENHKDKTNKLIADFSIHSEYLTTENFVKKIAEANSSLHSPINIHVSETNKEHIECKKRHNDRTPVKYFYDCGIFDNPTYLAHCVWIEEEDMDILKENNASIVHNPTSNCKLGSGIAPINRCIEKGINVCLGTDGVASNNNLNLFEEMHISNLLRKAVSLNPIAATAEETIKMATVNGARALGRYDTGEIKIGMKADIIAVSLDNPHMFPAFDYINLLVFSAQASDVVMTMVDGKILYENGNFTTIDVDKTRLEMQNSISHIML